MSQAAAYPTTDHISAEAVEIAHANPPSRVLLTCVLGILTAIGWLVGRFWFTMAYFAAFCGLAVKYGYRLGAKVPAGQLKKTTSRPA